MPKYDVAAYIWPSYHYEPRLDQYWPEKDGEWYTVRRATPRFPGHDMPRIPLLGEQDEADPAVMRQHVELALTHGINVFIVDWYWYDNAPCLERQLNEAILPAVEGTDMRFYLMWANHDTGSMWDMHRDDADILWTGRVDRGTLEPMFDRVIEKYLGHPNYYRIDGKPVFSVFDYPNLVVGLGGVEPTADAVGWLRQRCSDAGLDGLHLQAIARKGSRGFAAEVGAELSPEDVEAAIQRIGFDSATAYQYCMEAGPTGDYVVWAAKGIDAWPGYEKTYGVGFPHVSIGWDNTMRYPSKEAESVVTAATPFAFEACLTRAKAWLEARPDQPPLVTINSWNEWTEGSYLLPDMRWGYAYLRAVRSVFG